MKTEIRGFRVCLQIRGNLVKLDSQHKMSCESRKLPSSILAAGMVIINRNAFFAGQTFIAVRLIVAAAYRKATIIETN